MALVGYVRVSTIEQNPDLQYDALRNAGIEKLFEDKASGSLRERPGLEACLEYLRPGDTLVVWRLDRLGRNAQHLLEIGEQLRQRDIDLMIVTLGIDTRTPMGRMIYTIFAAFAEFERLILLERTADGRAAARARGRVGGRPRKLSTRQIETAVRMYSEQRTVAEIADVLGAARSTVYGYLRPPEPTESTHTRSS